MKARIYGKEITEYEVIKETKCTVTYIDEFGKQKTEPKITGFYTWHDSKEHALSYLIAKCKNEIDMYKAQIESKREEIIELKQKYSGK